MIRIDGNYIYQIDELPGFSRVEFLVDNVFHVELTVDKPAIAANGVDKAVVTAKVYDYAGVLQNNVQAITFDVEGVQTNVLTAAGQATIEITSAVAGMIAVKTVNPTMRNAGVVISAT